MIACKDIEERKLKMAGVKFLKADADLMPRPVLGRMWLAISEQPFFACAAVMKVRVGWYLVLSFDAFESFL